MDIGIWILSDRAVEVLMKRSLKEGTNDISYYDYIRIMAWHWESIPKRQTMK